MTIRLLPIRDMIWVDELNRWMVRTTLQCFFAPKGEFNPYQIIAWGAETSFSLSLN